MEEKVVVVGSLNMDIVAHVDRLPKEGETIQGFGVYEAPGGKGGNQAAAIGKLEVPVSMIGRIGSDANGDSLLASLRQSGVNTEAVLATESATGLAFIAVDEAGSNQIIVAPGANGELSAADIEGQRQLFEQCSLVVLQLEIPLETALYALRLAKQLGKTTILNPAPARRLDAELLGCVDYLIPNEHELLAMTGKSELDEAGLSSAAAELLEKGAKAIVVTLGDKGCFYTDGAVSEYFGAIRVDALDTTAAGDSFIGGFAAGYAVERDVRKAIRQAIAASSITVTRRGAQSSLPSRDEVDSQLNRRKAGKRA
ncbi:ribokinase [Paenibacillus arenilitoris]|uniref:Ribokinase n=1 Tax=Paenibacillus arenilitoris TaxID=2772299 RepID=A0A927H7X4_9BACL|nr:ribokinase [Paenibacillus arenilitoris]MBD2871098.1 ribokinase [Paenibacillus arenilitoris]